MKIVSCVKKFFDSDLLRIIVGAILFVPAFILSHLGIDTWAMIISLVDYFILGLPVVISAVRGILRRDLLDETFLMTIASVGAMIIGEWSEGVAVMLFFLVGEYFEHRAVAHSRNSIKELMQINSDTAMLIVDGVEHEVDSEDVEVGSLIVIKSGERVPIDAVVVSGTANVDTSALTGEAVPMMAEAGCEISSGSIVLDGVLTARTIRMAGDSAAARILTLVEQANERKAPQERFITVFSRYYTPIVVCLSLLMAIVPPIFSLISWADSVYRALTFLVISCPCALVISVPLAFFGGIGAAAKQGILYKGGNTFGALARATTVAFDKTGTLTDGELVCKVHYSAIDEGELLELAACCEYGSTHPIANSIKRAAGTHRQPENMRELVGRGIVASIDGNEVAVGNLALMSDLSVSVEGYDDLNSTCVYVAKGAYLVGVLIFVDSVRAEAGDSIVALKALGVKKCAMLSGDKRQSAEHIGAQIGIDEVHAELMPEDKLTRIAEYKGTGSVVFVGDGINDAPSLTEADVGIAMGGRGTDSAIESADVVIMSDNLMRIPTAIRIARRTNKVAVQNIVFALTVKMGIMVLCALGIANMWLAVFADVGVAMIAILNSMRTLYAKDR